jgi:ABC-type transport system involved in multi-copper enzyme maturation permease subunit
VLLVRDHKGVLESAKLSYEKTNGFWGKILGNAIVVGIVVFVVQMLLGFVLAFLGMRIAGILSPVVQMLATAFVTVFTVKLALTIERSLQKA